MGLGLPQGFVKGFSHQKYSNTNLTDIGDTNPLGQSFDITFSYGDDLSWQRGRHLFKFGAQFLRYDLNFNYGGNSGPLGIDAYTGAFSGGSASNSSIADFVLGYVDTVASDSSTSIVQLPGDVGQRQWRQGYYVQDDYKVRQNLTLNLGIRYDFYQPMYEVNNKQSNVSETDGTLQVAGVNGNSRAMYNPYYGGFEPRVGFAYTLTPKFVVRGGYGIISYFEGMGENTRLTQNPPWIKAFNTVALEPTGKALGVPLPVSTGAPVNQTNPNGATYRQWTKDIRPSETQAFNLTTEYQISKSSSVQVGYAGQLENHLATYSRPNQWPNSCAGQTNCFDPAYVYTSTPNSIGVHGPVQINSTRTTASMNYNALQAVYKQHNSKGLDVILNYTYSKAMTNGGNGFDAFGLGGAPGFWGQENFYNLNAEYGPSPLDTTHVLSASMVYDLPFGRGRQFASSINPVADMLFGGWKLSGVGAYYTGTALTITSAGNFGNQVHNIGYSRAIHLRPMHIANRSVNSWFGTDPSALACQSAKGGGYVQPNAAKGIGDSATCAYSTESYTNFSTGTNGSERSPSVQNVDLSLFKSFKIYEGHTLAFRADAFNAFNLTSLGFPDTNAGNSTFGQINNTRNSGAGQRNIQLGLNYHF